MLCVEYLKSIGYFLLAGLFEIGGGYMIWLWMREGKGILYAATGALLLVLYVLYQPYSQRALGACMPPMGESLSYYQFCGDGELIKSADRYD